MTNEPARPASNADGSTRETVAPVAEIDSEVDARVVRAIDGFLDALGLIEDRLRRVEETLGLRAPRELQ
jgi:hypothetical protein